MANESSGKKALKAGLGYTVGNMLVKGLSFLAIPLFARLMTVEDFGIYSTFSSYVMIVTVLAGFTLHTSVRNAKLDYAERTGSYCSSVTLLVIGNSLLLLALSLAFAAPLACDEVAVCEPEVIAVGVCLSEDFSSSAPSAAFCFSLKALL